MAGLVAQADRGLKWDRKGSLKEPVNAKQCVYPHLLAREAGCVRVVISRLQTIKYRTDPQVLYLSCKDKLARHCKELRFNVLDTMVLTRDIPDDGLRRGDLGASVEVYGPDAFEVEFVAASGRTQALVTLSEGDLRRVDDRDLISVRTLEQSAG